VSLNVETLVKLLQHGPLTRSEALDITGWRGRRFDHAVEGLRHQREIERVNIDGRSCWRLTDSARVRAFAEGERA
jgi:hypothetical protein